MRCPLSSLLIFVFCFPGVQDAREDGELQPQAPEAEAAGGATGAGHAEVVLAEGVHDGAQKTGERGNGGESENEALEDEAAPSDAEVIYEPDGHHILDELQGKILSRFDQDEPFGLGKGRKPKTAKRGDKEEPVEPKPRGRPPKTASAKPDGAAKSRAKRPKPDGDGDDAAAAAEKEVKRRKAEKPAPVQPPKKQKEKQNPAGKKATPKASRKASAKPSAKPKASPAGSKTKGRSPKAKAKGHSGKPKFAAFTSSQLVVYWSRDAVALKVPTGEGKTGLTQAGR